MGIPGLSTFVDNNLHLLEKCQLHDTKLIIDGNNLYHILYYSHHIDFIHGGDYDKFVIHTRRFFHMLKECNIQPYLIFDGGYDIDEKKFRTVLERLRQRCHSAARIGHGGKGNIMPILAYEVFRRTLLELGTPHCVCDFEADDQIVVLANEFGAPVLSYDSDFYIFDIHAGYVPIDSVTFTACLSEDEKYKYLPCCIYFTKNLTKHFPDLGKSVLPLMATLLGNDFVEHYTFEDFYQTMTPPKRGNSKFDIPIANTRMRSLFHWLENVKSLESGVERVMKCFKEEKRAKIERIMDMSLKSYSSVDKYSRVNLRLLLEESMDKNEEQCKGSHSLLPAWFRCSYWNGDIAQFCQNVVMLNTAFFACQVEDVKAPSTTNCCLGIRKVLYGILLPRKSPGQGATVVTSEVPEFVTEYTRVIKNIKKIKIEPLVELPSYGVLPVIGEVVNMKKNEKVSLLLSALGLSNSKVLEFPEELQLPMAILMYWTRESDPRITLHQLIAMIICILAMETIRIQGQTTQPGSETCELDGIIQRSSPGQVEQFLQNLRKYFNKTEHSKKHPVDMAVIHSFSQFQTCFLYSMILNQVLRQPFTCPSPATVFNGSFLYNFTKNLDSRPNVQLYILEVLVKHSPMLDFYKLMIQTITDEVGESHLNNGSIKVSGRRQRKGRKKKSDRGEGSAADCATGKDNDLMGMEVEVSCDVSNRFHSLHTMDNK